MKKIVAITGSPKPLGQSITGSLVNNFIDELKMLNPDIKSEHIYLNEKNIIPCTGCLTCQRTGKCVIDDDMKWIDSQMHEADILIFASPVHFG